MSKRSPPLKSLEVFVEAGTKLSFGSAGDALGLSPSAVSRRIRSLEEELEVALFVRRSKSVELTPTGEAYLEELKPAFAAIRRATAEIVRTNRRLVVTAPQSFAVSWLTPRLAQFRKLHPTVDIEVKVSPDITGQTADDFDIGIFLTRASWPGRYVEQLFRISVFPVTSPKLAQKISKPEDLLGLSLIHVRQLPNAWHEWFSAVGIALHDEAPNRRKDFYFNDVQLAYEAAQQGLGVAVGADAVVEQYLRQSSLVAPLRPPVRSALSYHFVCGKTRMRDPEVRTFHRWLVGCAANPDLR